MRKLIYLLRLPFSLDTPLLLIGVDDTSAGDFAIGAIISFKSPKRIYPEASP